PAPLTRARETGSSWASRRRDDQIFMHVWFRILTSWATTPNNMSMEAILPLGGLPVNLPACSRPLCGHTEQNMTSDVAQGPRRPGCVSFVCVEAASGEKR